VAAPQQDGVVLSAAARAALYVGKTIVPRGELVIARLQVYEDEFAGAVGSDGLRRLRRRRLLALRGSRGDIHPQRYARLAERLAGDAVKDLSFHARPVRVLRRLLA